MTFLIKKTKKASPFFGLAFFVNTKVFVLEKLKEIGILECRKQAVKLFKK